MIERISILGGRSRDGESEPVPRLDMRMGDMVSVVGPTGSGKTTLINDLELLASGDTPSGRRILVNDTPPPPEDRFDPVRNPIALITQHTSFLSDLPVGEFLTTHARVRRGEPDDVRDTVNRALDFANQLTGEPINPACRMTELSGGQTRALLIADAAIVCRTPIVLLDEVENAGIHRSRAIELLRAYRKIFIFVTHDPRIALLSDYRVVMKEGAMQRVLATDEEEKQCGRVAGRLDDTLSRLRDRIRMGGRLTVREMEAWI